MRASTVAVLGILAVALGHRALLSEGYSPTVKSKSERKELLVYCGITMIKPMSDIARIIESQENCKIIVTKDGSGNLLRAIEINRAGDLFLPGSDSYIDTAVHKGLVTDSVFVGYNKAAMMVRKGNPKNIPDNLESFANPDYYVVIGDPDSGSIGRETKKILEKRGNLQGGYRTRGSIDDGLQGPGQGPSRQGSRFGNELVRDLHLA